MWKSALSGIILENIETLRHYQTIKKDSSNTVDIILQYISKVITSLPWYFRLPIKMLATLIGLLCLITTRDQLHMLPSEKRALFLRRLQFFPSFSMLNKLVRSLAFLKLFDLLPLATDYSNAENCQ